jgi:hypothetical protein
MSGIIAVLFLGVTVKALGVSMVNDPHLMMHFWEVVEWVLNTLLFTLAGGLWGYNMGDNRETEVENDSLLSYKDWVRVYACILIHINQEFDRETHKLYASLYRAI